MSETRINTLHYANRKLFWGHDVDLSNWLELSRSAPVFLYNLKGIKERYQQMSLAWKEAHQDARIYYAMKANSHPEILKLFKSMGSGVDVVSIGEIQRAISCGFSGADMVFSGVGKSREEIEFAIKIDIHQLNVESISELSRISEIAKRMQKKVNISVRLNPNIDISTHPYIATGLKENKFGLELSVWDQVQDIAQQNPLINLVGTSLHLGSQMHDLSAFKEALQITAQFFIKIKKTFPSLKRFDIGGGLGIFYEKQNYLEEEKILKDYVNIVKNELKNILNDKTIELQTEPGRWLVAHSGVLLTEIQYIKSTNHKTFIIVNAGMNHLIRPALYEAYHRIYPLHLRSNDDFDDRNQTSDQSKYDIVGPICESSDFFAKDRILPKCQEGDVLCIADVGAYGISMASDYNLQVKPVEICIK